MRWTGAGLSASTALTNANVNTAGNGDTVATFNTSGTFTATMQTDGVLITGAASSIARFDVARTATKYGVGQLFYTPKEVPGATLAIYTFRSGVSGAAAVGSFVHYSGGTGGKLGFQNAAAATVTGATTTIDVVLNHEYQIDMVIALDATTPSTTNGRAFYRVKDLTDPTWNTTGDFYYDSGYTINVGTADLTQHRIAKVGNGVMNTGFSVRRLGWADLSSVNTSLTRATAESHFMASPFLTLSATGTGTTSGSADASIIAGVTTYALAATGTGTSDGSATVSLVQGVSATGSGTSGGSAAGSLVLAITATGTGTSSGSADIGRVHPLSASGAGGQTTGSANVIAILVVSATGTGATGGSAAIGRVHPLSATGAGTSGGSAAVTLASGPVVFALTATGADTSGGSAAATLLQSMSAIGAGVSGGSVAVSVLASVTSSGDSGTSGAANTTWLLAATADGLTLSGGSAELAGLLQLNSTGYGETGGLADLQNVTVHEKVPYRVSGPVGSTLRVSGPIGYALSVTGPGGP